MGTIHKQTTEPEVEGDRRFRKKRKTVQVRAHNSIKWSTPGHGMTWREKYNWCVHKLSWLTLKNHVNVKWNNIE